MTTRDDELLDILGASLGPPPDVEPTWAEISQLHRVIDSGWSGRQRVRTPLWRARRPLSAALAGFLVLGGASAAAAVSGAVMPEPVRVAARAVGLPVESPALADARAALARLRAAIARQPRDFDAIRARAQDVRNQLARLSADDRAKIESEAAFVLADADAALTAPPTGLGSPPPQQPTPPGATPAPATPAAAPAGDDHRRNEPAADQNRGRGTDEHPSGDDHSGPSASGSSGPSSPSGEGEHTATTQHVDNSGPGSSDGGGGSDGGSSHDGGSDGGGSSGSDGGGHSGPG